MGTLVRAHCGRNTDLSTELRKIGNLVHRIEEDGLHCRKVGQGRGREQLNIRSLLAVGLPLSVTIVPLASDPRLPVFSGHSSGNHDASFPRT